MSTIWHINRSALWTIIFRNISVQQIWQVDINKYTNNKERLLMLKMKVELKHSSLFSSSLYKNIHSTIFHPKPTRVNVHLIANCLYSLSWNACKTFHNFSKCGYNTSCIGRPVKFFDNEEEKAKNVRHTHKKFKHFVFVIVNI